MDRTFEAVRRSVRERALPIINVTEPEFRFQAAQFMRCVRRTVKEKRTEFELKALIMERIRQHPEWHYITNVVITRPQFILAPFQPNWDAVFVYEGKVSTPEGAFRIVQQLGERYELV